MGVPRYRPRPRILWCPAPPLAIRTAMTTSAPAIGAAVASNGESSARLLPVRLPFRVLSCPVSGCPPFAVPLMVMRRADLRPLVCPWGHRQRLRPNPAPVAAAVVRAERSLLRLPRPSPRRAAARPQVVPDAPEPPAASRRPAPPLPSLPPGVNLFPPGPPDPPLAARRRLREAGRPASGRQCPHRPRLRQDVAPEARRVQPRGADGVVRADGVRRPRPTVTPPGRPRPSRPARTRTGSPRRSRPRRPWPRAAGRPARRRASRCRRGRCRAATRANGGS
jgi:hypothetical protein